MDTITNIFKAARKVSTPLVAVVTPDPAATMRVLKTVLAAQTPVVTWNCVTGFTGIGNYGEAAVNAIEKENQEQCFDAAFALEQALKFPQNTIVFFQWMHSFMEEPRVRQAVWNLRDPYKQKKRTCVILAPYFTPPAELSGDMVIITEPLPDDEQLGGILDGQYGCVEGLGTPDPLVRRKAVEALRGLPAFTAEQSIALSMTPEGVNQDQLWDMKRSSIRNVPGLQMYTAKTTYQDLGGLNTIKNFHAQLFKGRRAPSAVIHLDELEKMLAGVGGSSGGDTSGTSQDQLGVLLGSMEDEGWTGIILVGAPGTGKTAIAMSTGPTFDVPTLKLDLGATKGGLVGQSEAQIRMAMRTIKGVAGEGAYFIATCNSLDRLPPELRRRFRRGIWYVDLPTTQELKAIWDINLKRFELDPNQPLPAFAEYTGADVRNICDNADSLALNLEEAAHTIVPVSVSDPSSIARLRDLSHGKFLDAGRTGVYRKNARNEDQEGSREYDLTM